MILIGTMQKEADWYMGLVFCVEDVPVVVANEGMAAVGGGHDGCGFRSNVYKRPMLSKVDLAALTY